MAIHLETLEAVWEVITASMVRTRSRLSSPTGTQLRSRRQHAADRIGRAAGETTMVIGRVRAQLSKWFQDRSWGNRLRLPRFSIALRSWPILDENSWEATCA